MDSVTRRVTAIALALTAIATVYAVTQDLFKAAIALAVALPFLVWGFWPRPSTGPRILLHGQDAFLVKSVGWGVVGSRSYFETDVLDMRFINSPHSSTENAVAEKLHGTFRCEGPDVQFPYINARIDSSPQPTKLEEILVETNFDLGIDEWKEFKLVIKDPRSESCFM